MDPLIILFGFGVGLLVGTTGMGGGSLMTPILILIFGFKPIVAIGTDLAYGAVTKTVGGWRHLRQHTVDMRLSWWMAAGSVPSAIGGVWVLEYVHRHWGEQFDNWLLTAVAGALFLTGFLVLGRVLFASKFGEHHSSPLELRHKVAAIGLGAAVGFVLGVTSAGSGTLIAVGLILMFRLAPQRVVGTDVFHAAILLWAAAIAHVVAGNVDFALAGTILLGSVPGVWIGSGLAVRLPVGTMRATLAIVLIAAGLGLLSKAGVDVPPVAVIGVPVLLALLTWLVGSLRRGVRVPAPERA